VLAHVLIWLCVVLTVLSGGIYLWQNRHVLKDKV
jgi:phosphatidylglycerophosphate synthase